METIFTHLPGAVKGAKLFVNASSRFLAHSVFLDERNLANIKRCHPRVVSLSPLLDRGRKQRHRQRAERDLLPRSARGFKGVRR